MSRLGTITRLKQFVRPLLLPVLQKLNLRPNYAELPQLSRNDRLSAKDVPSIVSFRDDQTILLNDAPFFPIGLYYAHDEIESPSTEGLRELRDIGFNSIAFRGGLEDEEQLNRIASAGMYVWYRPPGGLQSEYHLLKKVVSKFGRHPALLFWEMEDEPVFNKVDFIDVRTGCNVVRQLDHFHPILCIQWMANLSQAEALAQWANLADVNGFSIYPIPYSRWERRQSLLDAGWPHSVAIVGTQMDFWRNYVPSEPFIPVLQAWTWNCLVDGEAGYPTYQQSRFMAYQAVIHGAKGILYYGARSSSRLNLACALPPPKEYDDLEQTQSDFIRSLEYNDWFWSYHDHVVKELSMMSPIFVSRDAGLQLEVQAPDTVQFVVKQYRDSCVVLMVNAGEQPATIEATLPHAQSKNINVWGEGRTIPLNADGHFKDNIEPYGVRIYTDQSDLLHSLVQVISGETHGSYAASQAV